MPGRVVPLFRATWRELDLDTYRQFDFPTIATDRREVSSSYLLQFCGSQNFIVVLEKGELLRFRDRCTLPWEGRVTGPLNLQELSFSFDDVHQIEVSSCPEE